MKKFLFISLTRKEMLPVTRLLKTLGHLVHLKSCTNRAMVALRDISFDVIVVTDELRDMTGLEFVSRMMFLRHRKKIVFLTKHPRLDEKKETTLMGIDCYFPRFLGTTDLAALINWGGIDQNTLCLN